MGEGSSWDLRVRPGPAPTASGNLGTWKSGNLEIWGPGNPEVWDPKSPKIKILKMQIHSAQNVGKVWISREKSHLVPIWAILGHFVPWTGKNQKMSNFCLFSLVGQWALFIWCGPLLLSTRSGAIVFTTPDLFWNNF